MHITHIPAGDDDVSVAAILGLEFYQSSPSSADSGRWGSEAKIV